MATGFEGAAVKPVVDALIALFKKAANLKLKSTAKKDLTEAIRELLLAPNDLKSPEAKIAVARAAGIINSDLVLAEEMLQKHKVAVKKASLPVKAPARKSYAPAKKAAAKKAVAKRAQRTN